MKLKLENKTDQIIEALEILIESKISIAREAEYENHKEVSRITNDTYVPVKKLLKELLDFSKK